MIEQRSGNLRTTIDPGLVEDDILLKGGEPRLHVYRKLATGYEAVAQRSLVRQGDRLQIRYVVSEDVYGAIVSIDGRMQLTQHLPVSSAAKSDQAVRLTRGREVALPQSYQLDDAPQFERFFFLTSAEPFLISEALTHLAGGQELPSRVESIQISTFEVRK